MLATGERRKTHICENTSDDKSVVRRYLQEEEELFDRRAQTKTNQITYK